MTNSDVRGIHPSASSMERLMLCPGSHKASIGIEEVRSKEATSGTRIHAVIAGEVNRLDVSKDEEAIATQCELMAAEIIETVFPISDKQELPSVSKEKRLWAYKDGTETPLYSGKADLVVAAGSTALIIDFKTGRGITEDVTKNIQLRTLAVLVKEARSKTSSIKVAIVQPMVSSYPLIVAYSEEDLIAAKKQIEEIIEKSEADNAPRIPGETQCKYCPARSRCPEASKVVASVAGIKGALEELSAEHLAQNLNMCEAAESIIDSIRSEAKRRIETGQEVRGWIMKPGAIKQVINSPEVLYYRFYEMGGTNEQFMTAVTVTKGKFQDAVKEATGCKGAELKDKVESLLAGCTENKQNNPSLTKENKNDNS